MHGIGNDFVVLDAVHQHVELTAQQLRGIAHRRFGVGCDQILYVEKPTQAGVDFAYRIFNADGSEVEQCGNGARCFARFVRDKGLSDKDELVVETLSGIIRLRIRQDKQVTVNMGLPRFSPALIPLRADTEAARYQITVDNETHSVGSVSMGNPHAVLLVDDVDSAPVATLGAKLESHPDFPERVNVGFMQVQDREHIRLRVFERGSAETLACGTGACAAVVVGQRWGLLEQTVAVELPGGTITVAWQGAEVWLTGPAATVFEGTIEL
jgi:diaminopimelate epimerase